MELHEMRARIIKKHRFIATAARRYSISREHLSKVLHGEAKLTPGLRIVIEGDLTAPAEGTNFEGAQFDRAE